jgi:hypothetical protein
MAAVGSADTRSAGGAMTAVSGQMSVDTKSDPRAPFGNDAADVDTKRPAAATFGNDAIGFIRVRKRKIKGGHRDWRAYRAQQGILATTSASFDLVRAVRVNGKPRHQFVLGLGSQKDIDRRDLCWFWSRAVHRMIQHGLAEAQRAHLISEMVRKGARVPTIEQCEHHARGWPRNEAAMGELIAWLQGRKQP